MLQCPEPQIPDASRRGSWLGPVVPEPVRRGRADESDLAVAVIAVEQHGLSFWDAMLWATARRAGCRVLLSEDFQDGRDLGGILFVNPLEPANRKLLDLALPERRG